MRKIIRLYFISIILSLNIPLSFSADLINFWNIPQKGANSFNKMPPNEEYFKALSSTGATWVRLTFSKWDSAERDFLLGNADNYISLNKQDLYILRKSLDAAHAAGIKVVIVPLSLPGARWQQQNQNKFDDRLWSESELGSSNFSQQSTLFWRDLATELKDHPAIAAYNIINEPAPEKTTSLVENSLLSEQDKWQQAHANTSRDLSVFYEQIIQVIRTVDPVTPIMVDSGYYANPRAFASWPNKLADERILYAFHMYEPYIATSSPNMKREKPFSYPGVITDYNGEKKRWDTSLVHQHIAFAFQWAKSKDIPASRMVAAEFGCMRLWSDCGTYLKDVMTSINKQGGHWAFYAFREDEWEGMNYELPVSIKPGQYYWLADQGQLNKLPVNGDLMLLIKKYLNEKNKIEK